MWYKEYDIQNEIKILKHIINPKDLTFWGKFFIKKNEDILINFDIPSENDLIRKCCGQSPRSHNQSETAQDGKKDLI